METGFRFGGFGSQDCPVHSGETGGGTMKLVVTGGSGQLGRAIQRLGSGNHEVKAYDSSTLDVTDLNSVREVLTQANPDLVIHAGAMTDVDGCEHDIERAYRINALGAQPVVGAT